ncbi:MAG: choice-of-anchor J domain-containing protein [Bacteroidales bacterium]|nr:choice-of-anchor J domain-containing protein [Bacteroidales bacterium]
MRKFTILLAFLMIASFIFGQYLKEEKILTSPNNKTTEFVKNNYLLNNAKEVVFLETFDTWPPEGWTIIEGTECQGTQHWYGGPGYAAIAWDDDGDGTARPQDEWMITPDIIVPSEGGIFSFQFHSNPYWLVSPNNNVDLLLKISTDGGTNWVELWNEDDYTWEYDVWTEVMLELDAYADQTVKFAIQYVGTDACWVYIDNVTVFTADNFDVSLIDARVDFWPYYIDYGYSGFFGQIPFDQLNGTDAPVYFSGIIKNRGNSVVTPELTVSVLDPSEAEVFTSTVAVPNALSFDNNDTAYVEDPYFTFNPATIGTYTINFTAAIPDEVDSDPTNNSLSYETNITHNIYAHDGDNHTGRFSTCLYDGDFTDGDIIGVIYQFFASTPVNNISFFVPTETEVGTSYIVKLMTESETGWDELASSTLIEIESANQTDIWHTVTFVDEYSIDVPEGEMIEVLAAIEYYTQNGVKKFFVGSDGIVPTLGFETKMYFALEDTWYYYGGSQVPMIRMNVGITSSVDNIINNDVSVFPNPSTSIITLSNVEGATIEIINIMGQVVKTVNSSYEVNNIDLSNFANGTYFVKVVKGSNVSTSKINLVK